MEAKRAHLHISASGDNYAEILTLQAFLNWNFSNRLVIVYCTWVHFLKYLYLLMYFHFYFIFMAKQNISLYYIPTLVSVAYQLCMLLIVCHIKNKFIYL